MSAKARRAAHLDALAMGWKQRIPRAIAGPMRLAFRLPWPPSVNHYWTVLRRGPQAGIVIISDDGKAYRKQVGLEILRQAVPRFVLTGRLGITVMACPADWRARDLDNLWKGFLDALKYAAVIQDDSHFDDERIYRGPIITDGLLHVEIVELPGPTATFCLPLGQRDPILDQAMAVMGAMA